MWNQLEDALRQTDSETVRQSDRSLRHDMLMTNPIVDMWRICFVANSFVFPMYRDMEMTHDLTRPEFVTMFCLGTSGALVAQDIVAATGLPKNSISRAVHRLQQRGLVRRRDDSVDKRRSILELTPDGRALYDDVLPKLIERTESTLSALDPSERETLTKLMLKVAFASDR